MLREFDKEENPASTYEKFANRCRENVISDSLNNSLSSRNMNSGDEVKNEVLTFFNSKP